MKDATTIERPQPSSRTRPVQSSIKAILVHIQNDASVWDRLQLSISLARATAAHLTCLQITPIEAYVTMKSFGLFAMEKAMEEIDSKEEKLRSSIEAHLKAEDVSFDYEVIEGNPASELIRRAALADLVIKGRAPHSALVQRPELHLLGDLLSVLRTPLLIPCDAEKSTDLLGPAIIAWNGSLEAANAARAALGLLKLASKVQIIRYTEEKEAIFPDVRLTQYLSRHDIDAQLEVRTIRSDCADALIQYASLNSASVMVMGAYGHSRAGEFLFGGVTRELLRNCPISLVLAH